jgi:1-acyl-sn-glycerol-3-phosphate acyltransferase
VADPTYKAPRPWRQLVAGLTFLYYGVGLAALAVWLLVREKLVGHDVFAAQRLVQRAYASFIAVAAWLGSIRLTTRGAEALAGPGPRLVVANHPSLIDSALVVRHLPQADSFVSPEWATRPLFRTLVAAVEALPSDAGAAAVDAAVARLRAGRSVVMFPEGTRSPAAGLGRFHRGAAHVALASGCDLLPVVIRIDPPTTRKGERWYDVPEKVPEVEVRVMPPLSPGKVLDGSESPMLAARKVNAALRDIYEKVLDLG